MMNNVKKVLLAVLMAAIVMLGQMGCAPHKEHPSGEHPSKEHPSKEHPAGEHPAGEHPAGEHPK
jgi:hypothetical protein